MSAAPVRTATPRVAEPAPSRARPGQAGPGRSTPGRQPAPLRVVRQRKAPARAPFVLVVAGLLSAGLVTVLLVNTWLAQGSFTLRRLQEQQSALDLRTQALQQKIEAESAPGALAARAQAMGMVAAPAPVFKLPDGHIVGVAEPGVRPAPPPPPPTPTPSPSPTPTATSTGTPAATPAATPDPTSAATPDPTSAASTSAVKPSAVGAKPSTSAVGAKPTTSPAAGAPVKPTAAAPTGGHA